MLFFFIYDRNWTTVTINNRQPAELFRSSVHGSGSWNDLPGDVTSAESLSIYISPAVENSSLHSLHTNYLPVDLAVFFFYYLGHFENFRLIDSDDFHLARCGQAVLSHHRTAQCHKLVFYQYVRVHIQSALHVNM